MAQNKLLVIFAALIVCATAAVIDYADINNTDEDIEKELTTRLEEYKTLYKNGIASKDIPPMDPLKIDNYTLDFNEYDIPDIR